MLCPNCGHFSTTDHTVCSLCGKLLPRLQNEDAGVRAIRQGKRARVAARLERSVPVKPEGLEQELAAPVDPEQPAPEATEVPLVNAVEHPDPAPPIVRSWGNEAMYADADVFDANGDPVSGGSFRRQTMANEEPFRMPVKPDPRSIHPVQRHMVNWAKVLVALVALVMVGMIGVGLFLTRTSAGQRIMARAGFEATSTAMWQVGDERMDVGDIDGAIDYYLKAIELDGDEVNVSGMLALGGAYEAADRLTDAEALYVHIYTDIVPSASEAYTNVIRIMLADGREAEAAVLMKLAYQKTGNSSFSTQRSDLLPAPPSVNIAAGYYEQVKTLVLSAAEDCTIYYTFDEKAVLPYDGIEYTQPLTLDEKTWPLRAVAVKGDLVSDPLSAVYTVSMPSPGMPYPSLAANTYSQRQRVRIFQNIERTRDPNIVIYYTIDGSTPDADSPIYDQDAEKGILLPYGNVTLRAVAVNEYGKASNVLQVGYKIETKGKGKEPLSSYTYEDTADGIRLNGTTFTDFTNKYGQPQSQEELVRSGFAGKVTKYSYAWGYAVFHNLKGTNNLIELYFTNNTFHGPRSTGIGDTMDFVVGKFRDMTQPESPSGNRGLYSNDKGTGRIYVNGNGTRREGESTIIYAQHPVNAHVVRYTCRTVDSHTWSLDYITDTSGKVVAIDMLYIP